MRSILMVANIGDADTYISMLLEVQYLIVEIITNSLNPRVYIKEYTLY